MLTKLNDPGAPPLRRRTTSPLAWLGQDPEWTSEKGSQNNNLASNTVPLLDRAAPAAGEGGGPMMAAGARWAAAGGGGDDGGYGDTMRSAMIAA